MIQRRRLFPLLALWLLNSSCAHNTAHAPSSDRSSSANPTEELFQNPPLIRLTPDGSQVAITELHQGAPAVRILATTKTTEPVVHSFPSTYSAIRDLFWKNSRHLVLSLELKTGAAQQIVVLDLEQKTQKILTPETDLRYALFHPLWDVSKDEVLVLSNRQNPDALDVYRLHLDSNKLTLAVKNPGTIERWIADSKGRVRVAMGRDGLLRTVYFRFNDNIPFKKVLTIRNDDVFEPLGMSADGTSFYARSNMGREHVALVLMSGSAKEISTVASPERADVMGIWQDRSGRTLGYRAEFLEPQWHILDERLQPLYSRIRSRFPGNLVTVEQMTSDGKILLVRAESGRAPAVHSVYFEEGDRMLPINSIDEGPLTAVKTEVHQLESQGVEVAAYVTRPLQTRSRATLVWFPSGPEERFRWGFDPEVNHIATQGINVVRMLPRGTPGMGRKMRAVGQRQWGAQRLNDAARMVKHLQDKDALGSERICSFGVSLGGTESLLAPVLDPRVFTCSAALAPILNLPAYLENIPPYWEARRDFLYEVLGHPVKDRLSLLQSSPQFRAKDFNAPLFVAHGGLDPHTQTTELDQWIDQLRSRGVKTQVLRKSSEGHVWLAPEALGEFRKALVQFVLR